AAIDGPWLDMSEAESEVLLLAHRFARCRQIATDRLHAAILGVLLDCEVTLHANVYFKNEAVHDHTLAQAAAAFAPGAIPPHPALDPLRQLLEETGRQQQTLRQQASA